MRLIGCMLLAVLAGAGLGGACREPGATAAAPGDRPPGPRSRGTVWSRDGASPGYVLFSPLLSTTTYLIDHHGTPVHTWESEFGPGASVYLLDDGHLLRSGRQPGVSTFRDGGLGGRIQMFSWDGRLVWDWVQASEDRLQHHDIEPLPNGNVLLLAWERKSREEAIRAGRHPDLVGADGLWPDHVVEVRPRRPNGAEIVWEWHAWDHLIQDHDPRRENFGVVADHPERIDINGDRRAAAWSDEVVRRLKALGYLAGAPLAADRRADFLHTNSIDYDPRLDQIALSVSRFHEIWIIDHGTTREEAAGHTGGRAGRGGDLLYRWGNPSAYGRGTAADQRLFAQHDARWIPDGHPGAGNLMVFNNGADRADGSYSSVIEIRPPVAAEGRYAIEAGRPFGPEEPAWQYTAPDRESFFADFISGAHRLVNGNTFICAGPEGRFFEVTAGGEVVWELFNPFSGDAPNPAGDPLYSVFRATHLAPDHPALAGLRQ